MKFYSTHGIGLYFMEQWDMSISNVQLIEDYVLYPQDLNEAFESSEQDLSLPDLCNNYDYD